MLIQSNPCGFCKQPHAQSVRVGITADGESAHFLFCGPCLKRMKAHELFKAVFRAMGTEYTIEDTVLPPTMNPAKIPGRIRYIAGILRNRLNYFNAENGIVFMAEAHNAGVPIEHMEDVAKSLTTKTWTDFKEQVEEAISVIAV